ncbi:MAG: hypothetical protein LC115_11205 [Bacteroidia bacterium]|nr:hypothetical protein [Bacteroidia bacterium]
MSWKYSKIVDNKLFVSSLNYEILIVEGGNMASSRSQNWQTNLQKTALNSELLLLDKEDDHKPLESFINTGKQPKLIIFVPFNERIGEALLLEKLTNDIRQQYPAVILWADFANSWQKTAHYGLEWELNRFFVEKDTAYWTLGAEDLPGTISEDIVWQPEVTLWQNHHQQAKSVRTTLLQNNCTRLNKVSNDFCERWDIQQPSIIPKIQQTVSNMSLSENQSWVIHY